MATSAARRQALKLGLLACVSSLFGIGKDDDTPLGGLANSTPALARNSSPSQPPVWDPSPWLMMSPSESTVTIDMSITLPAEVRRGGIFDLAADSSPLPAGAKLTRAGILTVEYSKVGSTSNLVFTYSEPKA